MQLIYSKQEERGIHVAVLHQATGELMAARVFDTYMPGSEDDLVSFINSISEGRVLCLAILVSPESVRGPVSSHTGEP